MKRYLWICFDGYQYWIMGDVNETYVVEVSKHYPKDLFFPIAQEISHETRL